MKGEGRIRGVAVFVFVVSLIGFASAEDLLSEDLLSEDEELDFEVDETHSSEQGNAWYEAALRLSFEQALVQGDDLEQLRSSARLEYEQAPWQGGYVKFDYRYRYFWSSDELARDTNSAYGKGRLQDAWVQQTSEHCNAKLGRQQVFWGAVEGTFAVDVISPFDFTENLLTDFSSIRLSQDMLNIECFVDQSQWQVFFQPRATIDQIRHKNNAALEALESTLNEEWGLRYQRSWTGFDVSLMYARLYGNTPVPVLDPNPTLHVPRFDFYGFSTAWALGRLLLELDLGFKQDQLKSLTGERENRWEAALGFEYTTAANHQWNGGVWSYESSELDAPQNSIRRESLTLGWRNSYLNDDLSMSLLGNYLPDQGDSNATLQGQYKWDDYWTLTNALGYSDISGNTDSSTNTLLVTSGWLATLMAKVQF